MSNLELRRERADARVAGVCAGLARSWGLDPRLVRVGFVVLTLVTNGFGAVVYLALAVLLPERGGHGEPIRELLPFTRGWTSSQLLAFVVIATVVLGSVVIGSGPGSLVVALLVLALLRWGRRTPPPPTLPARPEPRTEFERLAAAWGQRLDNVAAGLPPDWSPAPAAVDPDPHGLYSSLTPLPPPPDPTRARRGLRTWSGVALAGGLVWAGLAALGNVTVVSPLAWCAATLAVFSLALVVVSRPRRAARGRPTGLLIATLVAALATTALLVDAPGPALAAPRGESVVTYASTTPLADHEFGLGSTTVDLTGVTVARDQTARLTADVGRLRVLLPASGNVVVHYGVELGAADIGGHHVRGLDTSATWSRITSPGEPTLTLDLAVDVGALEVVTP